MTVTLFFWSQFHHKRMLFRQFMDYSLLIGELLYHPIVVPNIEPQNAILNLVLPCNFQPYRFLNNGASHQLVREDQDIFYGISRPRGDGS